MFGVHGTSDTSGYGKLRVHKAPPVISEPPYGGYFDTIADALGLDDAIERVVIHNGEMTVHVKRDRLVDTARKLRDDPALAFELCLGVSGVHYLDDTGRELHAVYHFASIRYNRRLRVETTTPDSDR